jgi:hypothetical protein
MAEEEDYLEGTVRPPGPEILKLSTDQEMPKEDRVPLFSIDGTTYSLLRNPPPTVGLRYMHLARTSSIQAATDYLLEVMLGAEGYEALMNYEQLTREQFDWVMDQAIKRSLGPKDRPKVRSGISAPNS